MNGTKYAYGYQEFSEFSIVAFKFMYIVHSAVENMIPFSPLFFNLEKMTDTN